MSLLDPSLLRELEALRRHLRITARSGLSGAVTASRKGGAVEFEEHRAYDPGDDAARVDWMALARTGQPFLKQFRADEDAVVRVVLDASLSLGFGAPTKLDLATRLAAAIGYLALASGERASVALVTGASVRATPARRGKGGVASLLHDLSDLSPDGAADVPAAVDRVVATARRPGLLVVVSDFLDDAPLASTARRARFAGHDLALVQVLSEEELDPALEGDLELEDAETGARVDLTVDPTVIRAYRARLAALFDQLRAIARESRGTYVRARTTEPLPEIVRRFVRRSID